MSNTIDGIAEKQQAATALLGELKASLTVQDIWPEAFALGGPVGLKMVGKMLPYPSRRTAPYKATLTGPAGSYILTREELQQLKPALTLHPDFEG